MSESDGGGGLRLYDAEGKQSRFVYGSVRTITVFLFLHLCRYVFSERYYVYTLSPRLHCRSYNAHEVVITDKTRCLGSLEKRMARSAMPENVGQVTAPLQKRRGITRVLHEIGCILPIDGTGMRSSVQNVRCALLHR